MTRSKTVYSVKAFLILPSGNYILQKRLYTTQRNKKDEFLDKYEGKYVIRLKILKYYEGERLLVI